MKIGAVIRKNFKLILRSKTSALILLLGPLLIIMLVGLAFNTGQSLQVNVGYHMTEKNNLTDSFIELLTVEQYVLKEYASETECKTAIAGGLAHICIIFPKDFSIANDKVNEIRFLVDNSKINLFESVVDSIENKFNQRAMELSAGLTSELLEKLNETQSEVGSKLSVFEQLKKENKQAQDNVRAIARNVTGMELTINTDDFKMNELSSTQGSISSNVGNLRKYGEDAVDKALDLIDDLEGMIDDLDINESDDMLDLLNETESDLRTIMTSINSSYTRASNETTKLASGINSAKTNLQKVQDKLKKAQDAQGKVGTLSANTLKTLNESLQKINAVEASFKKISSSIAGTKVTDVETIVSPIVKKVEPVVSTDSQLDFYFPYLIVLVVMFIGILLASTLLIMEKTSNAHFRNLITPTGELVFILGHFFTTFTILAVQAVVILAIYVLYFNKPIAAAILSTSVILFFVISIFTMIGMIIGNLFGTEETGTLASISASSVFLFISDLVYPLEKMPPYIAEFARQYNPFVFGTDLLRKSMVHKAPIESLGGGIMMLLLFLIGTFIFTLLVHKLNNKQYLLRAAGYVSRRQLGRKYQAIKDEKLLQASKENKDEFVSKSGKAKDLKELIDLTQKMEDDEFKENISGNTYPDWAKNCLKNDGLAELLRKERTRKGVMSVLKQTEKYYEKMEKKAEKK